MIDVAERLLEHGIRLKAYEVGEHAATCPQCSSTRKKAKDPCLGVKVDGVGGAAWYCHHCGWRGNLPTGQGASPAPPAKVYRRPAAPKEEPRPAAIFAWFERRGISEETVNAFRCYVTKHWFPSLEEERDCLALPYFWRGELVNVKYRTKVAREDGTEGKTFAQEAQAQPTLFNIDALAPDEVIFVEGEIDVMSLWEAGFQSVVTLPNGAGKDAKMREDDKRLEPLNTHAEALMPLKKILIATDMDEPGEVLAQQLASRFGRDRCWRVTFPDGCKDANETLMKNGAAELAACIARAEPWPMDGVQTVSAFATQVWDRYYGRGPQPLSTCIPGLDRYWMVMPQTFNVISGYPNHGKSNFIDQVMVEMGDHHGWNFAFFSPEHPIEDHIVRLSEKVAKLPFYDGPTPKMSKAQVADALDWLLRHVSFVESKTASPTVDWLIERFRWCAVRRGINAVVIDPYNQIEASKRVNQSETEFIAELIGKLQRFARAHDVAIFMVVHPTKSPKADAKEKPPTLNDLHGSAHWRNMADAGVIVHRDYDTDETLVIVRKIREQPRGGNIGMVALRYDIRTRRYVAAPPRLEALSAGGATGTYHARGVADD